LRCSSSSTPSSCSRSEPRPRRRPAAVALTLLLALAPLAGCGGDQRTTAAGLDASPDPGGTLTIALADRIRTLDPLHATGRAERLASRQVYEPLRTSQRGPFGDARRRPGIVLAFRANAEATVWTARLRHGASFQSGEPLDAGAILDNADRWLGSAAGRALLPVLAAADSPRPGLVRFLLDRPARRFPVALAEPRLGIVAPAALADRGDGPARMGGAGTGPFELRESDAGGVLLARNAGWWGTALGLGPGVDQIELTSEPDAGHRVEALLSGAVDVADELGRGAVAQVRSAPLLTTVGGKAAMLGMERSVRGLDSASACQPLADVWLTDLR
jgi:peptide/nickel transport system substrate-binding protein